MRQQEERKSCLFCSWVPIQLLGYSEASPGLGGAFSSGITHQPVTPRGPKWRLEALPASGARAKESSPVMQSEAPACPAWGLGTHARCRAYKNLSQKFQESCSLPAPPLWSCGTAGQSDEGWGGVCLTPLPFLVTFQDSGNGKEKSSSQVGWVKMAR
jgi:hypothetical protein